MQESLDADRRKKAEAKIAAEQALSASVLLLCVPRIGHLWRECTLSWYQSDLRRTHKP